MAGESICGSLNLPSSLCVLYTAMAFSTSPSLQEFYWSVCNPFPLSILMRVSQGFWGTREHWQNIEGNKGTLANFWEQGNKIRKITVRKHSERVWGHGNIGQFWKGTREQRNKDPPGRPSLIYFQWSLCNLVL